MVIVPAIPSARFMRTTSWGQFAIKSSHELCCAGYPRRGETPTITYRRWRFTPLAFWSNDSLSVAIHKTIKFAVALVTHHHQAVEFHSKRIRVCRGTRTFVIGSCSTSVMATIMRNVNWTINSNFGTFIPSFRNIGSCRFTPIRQFFRWRMWETKAPRRSSIRHESFSSKGRWQSQSVLLR